MVKKEYFIDFNGNKQGAFTLDELIKMDIYDNTLVWKSGWDEWKFAKDCQELKDIYIETPPPTHKEKEIALNKKNTSELIKALPKRLFASVLIIILSLTLIAFFGALFNESGRATIGIYGYLILGVLMCAIYLIYKIWRKKVLDISETYYGTQKYKDGSFYEGEKKNGLPNGKGKYTFTSGEFIIGNFVDNKLEGKATIHFPNGSARQAEYNNDKIIRYID